MFDPAAHWKIQPCMSQSQLLSASEIPASVFSVLKGTEAY